MEREYDITEVEHTIRLEQRHPEKRSFSKVWQDVRILRDDKISKTILMFISQETAWLNLILVAPAFEPCAER